MTDIVIVTAVRFHDSGEQCTSTKPMAITVRSGDRDALRNLFTKARMRLTPEAEQQVFERVERDGVAEITGFAFES
jgi:hypothetical protein